ncbi:MAG: tRNA (N6-threonylcarbamoyladenosine(37)-N6)-methyltransferase TrmO [Bdellovibrionaceae bacterium]|nr:tRNA (N6-threonylcarbamoyladenosine(37)-N6)-methyltransferase TrmO [Pseudobdellovibrionaceae bacterium]
MNLPSFQFDPIGFVQSCYRERFGTPRQPGLVPEAWGVIRLRPELNLADGLDGLAGFSHLWVIFVFHQNTNKILKTKVHPPRLAGEKMGVFATRSPHRPNPIGLSVVKIEKIQGNDIYVSGLDLIEGTPVLDIKPYVPSADRVPDAHGGWTTTQPERFLDVLFSDEALAQIAELDGKAGADPERNLAELIRQTLELDPRPGFYKGTPENENPYTDTYGFGLENFNVVYRVQGRVATVLRLENWEDWSVRRT